MTVEARDRKILWARSHNACAICRQPLVLNATETDRESVVGDEAHIVAQSSGGPRAGLIPVSDLDKYDNLILPPYPPRIATHTTCGTRRGSTSQIT